MVRALEQDFSELLAAVAALQAASGSGSSGPTPQKSLLDALAGLNTATLGAAIVSAEADRTGMPVALVRALATATLAQPQSSIAAGAAVERLPVAARRQAQQGGDSAAVATSVSAGYERKAHDLATCAAPGCRICAYARRLQRQRQAQGGQQGQQQQQQQQGQQQGPPSSAEAAQQAAAAAAAAAAVQPMQLGSSGSGGAMAAALRDASSSLDQLMGLMASGSSSGGSEHLIDALVAGVLPSQAFLPHPSLPGG